MLGPCPRFPKTPARQSRRRIILSLVALACNAGDSRVTGGVVSAASPEAADAGARILGLGGNAVDAMVAVQFALGVTEPAMSGLGGQTQVLMMSPDSAPRVINGTSWAPQTLPANVPRGDLVSHRASTVPTTVNTLDYAWRKYGSGRIAWDALLAPAIQLAEDGFVVGPFRRKVWERHLEDLRNDPAVAKLFLIDGEAPERGALFRQPVLAQTLRRIAEHGAQDFYRGEIAQQIVEEMAANGGWITAADLSGVPAPMELEPLHSTYRGYEVYTLPPPGGGWVVLQLLNLFEQFPANELDPGTDARPLALARALRIGHRSRQTDPVPDLVNYGAAVSERISKATAQRLMNDERGRGETTHFSVVDGNGMVVSVTASINAYFGSRSVAPGLGFLFNSYMHEFQTDRLDHPFALRGGAMPYSSMSPTVVSRDGVPLLALGSPGSARIISAVAQVSAAWMDGHGPLTQVVALPRVHVVPEDRVYLESAVVTDAVIAGLESIGLTRTEPSRDLMIGSLNAYFGGVHAVAFENGAWTGAADPRRDGAVRVAVRY